jgi:hypothetical protein
VPLEPPFGAVIKLGGPAPPINDRLDRIALIVFSGRHHFLDGEPLIHGLLFLLQVSGASRNRLLSKLQLLLLIIRK